MKKRILIVLIVVLMLLVPHAASANSPARNPWEITVYLEKVPKGTEIKAFLAGGDGVFRLADEQGWTSDGTGGQKTYFYFREGDTQFYLMLTAPDGTETRTNTVEIVTYGKYTCNGAENLLEERTEHYNTVANCKLGSQILLFLCCLFLLPIAVTLLIEWLTALCFGIRPVKHVLIINAITNPIMNLLLLIASALLLIGHLGYWFVLILLETAVIFIEYWYYKQKYPEIGHRKLLLFSITANVLSLVLGGLAQYFFI